MQKPLSPGAVLRERYKIKRIIGQGGVGNVYLADDLRLEGRLCAIKEVDNDLTTPEEMLRQARDQFFREATVLARLDHPNLPKVSDFFSDDEKDYLVMDFVPGKDLRAIMIEHRNNGEFIPERKILAWAGQLADAISYLHSLDPPILHRDIKPSNMKVTPSGLLKLVDFGLVKFLAPEDVTVTILQGRGTALYTPLEQYGGDSGHTDTRSDIYAFGATMYHLLAGKAPVEARERFLNPGILPDLQDINSSISFRTQRAVLWAMSLHPSDRPPDIEAFRRSLLGDWSPSKLSRVTLPSPTLADVVSGPAERSLAIASGVLLLISLLITLTR